LFFWKINAGGDENPSFMDPMPPPHQTPTTTQVDIFPQKEKSAWKGNFRKTKTIQLFFFLMDKFSDPDLQKISTFFFHFPVIFGFCQKKKRWKILFFFKSG